VVWVDTIDFKEQRSEAAARERSEGEPSAAAGVASELVRAALALLETEVELEIVPSRLFDDDVVIRLPKRLAVARPTFRLHGPGGVRAPDENAIEDGRIVLTFNGVSEFGPDAGALELHVETLAATLVLRWRQEGPDLYAFDGFGAE
jgi:hypothetical protein